MTCGEVAGRGVYVFLRHHAVMDDGLVGVDVLQIGVQGVDALLQALLQFVVFVGFDNARHRVVREQPVMVFAVLVDAETHTVAGQLSIDRFARFTVPGPVCVLRIRSSCLLLAVAASVASSG